MEKRQFKTLKEIYDYVPKLACKKKCSDACGWIPVTPAELVPITRLKGKQTLVDNPLSEHGQMFQPTPDGSCPHLQFKECTVYEARPLICRLFGVVPKMVCEHGCVPERYLTTDEAYELIDATHALLMRGKRDGQHA